MCLRIIEWVDSYLLAHAGQDFQPELFLVPQAKGPSLDNRDLVVQPFDEPEGDLLLRPAVRRNAVPLLLNHLGEFLVGT